jgi:creatinine amidohydrolase/Fe(II)-dependent formamide hydrolase-like protein
MEEEKRMTKKQTLWMGCLWGLLVAAYVWPQDTKKALILQELTWVDVQEYLKTSDMVIIPLGSTEQHGPHMPLGTDSYEAEGISKIISERTGVLVAPVLWVGYSIYHSGFPGTLSLKPETMEQVLYETAQMLIKYGFRRFMFFNYHGGNNIVQDRVIHRINHTTEAIGVAIGHGGHIQKGGEGEFFDWHAGKGETSLMLYLRPDLVRMERAEKPDIHFTERAKAWGELAKKHPEMEPVWSSLFGVPQETGKGGASHELSSNGVWSFSHPNTASRELGERDVNRMVENAVKFIEIWKQVTY